MIQQKHKMHELFAHCKWLFERSVIFRFTHIVHLLIITKLYAQNFIIIFQCVNAEVIRVEVVVLLIKVKVKVKQSHCRLEQAQRVPGD